MKKILLIVIALFSLQMVSAQESPKVSNEDNNIYSSVEVKPEFPGGIDGFYNYVSSNYKAPSAKKHTGKVIVLFVIEKDGSVSDAKVVGNVGYDSVQEITRILKESPKWTPAKQQGNPVRYRMTLPITVQSDK